MNANLDKLYTIKETVQKVVNETGLDFKERKLMYMIRTGKVKAQKVGWIWVIPESEVERIIADFK